MSRLQDIISPKHPAKGKTALSEAQPNQVSAASGQQLMNGLCKSVRLLSLRTATLESQVSTLRRDISRIEKGQSRGRQKELELAVVDRHGGDHGEPVTTPGPENLYPLPW